MDTVPRRRRGAGGEPELEAAAYDAAYQTALSQTGMANLPSGVGARGEASPGALEMGEGSGVRDPKPLPVANPFHSERVHAEIQLIHSRPQTLDEDGQRIRSPGSEGGLGSATWNEAAGEPDYGLVLGGSGSTSEVPRVARIESSAAGTRVSEEASSLDGVRGTERRAVPQDAFAASGGIKVAEVRAVPPGASDVFEEPELQPVAKDGFGVEDSEQVHPEDQRELIPAETDRLTRLELLLNQVIEENKGLRKQIQAESSSSWHSARTPAEQPVSPASFGMGSQFGDQLQHQYFGVQHVDTSVSRDFPGFVGRFPTGDWEPSSGQLHSLVRSRTTPGMQQPSMGPLALGVLGHGAPGLTMGYGLSSGSGEYTVSGTPAPPPVFPSGFSSSTRGDESCTQTLRQFASSMLQGTQDALEGGNQGFVTPRSGDFSGRFDAEGYPLSPGGTSIRPPAGPPPVSPRVEPPNRGLSDPPVFPTVANVGTPTAMVTGALERPEEPAKYINELPKLVQVDLAQSAVVCGNWLAQVRQVLVGLSPSADVWWKGVEGPATAAYRRWLVADPLGRLSLDPSSVVGVFDGHRYGRVESRATSLLLAAVPQTVRDDVVTNRWLSSTAILFRVLCLFQPGGSSERSHLLSQLVSPDSCRTFAEAIKGLRKWQQGLQRAGEIHATLPDASLLLKGIDGSTASLLSAHPMIGFRVNAFRHQLGIDYNPTVASVVQLVRLIQAECEAASITVEGNAEKRARTAALSTPKDPPPAKAPPTPPPAPSVAAAVVSGEKGDNKGKGSSKGKGTEGVQQPCHKFSDATGCRFGDSCMFRHDRTKARKEGRCLACGQSGHYRPDCTLVAPENRPVLGEPGSASEGSPKSSPPGGKGGKASKAKAKPAAQAKGIIEEAGSGMEAARPATSGTGQAAGPNSQELIAEAAKLLKNVSLKPVRVQSRGLDSDVEIDSSWLLSAISGPADKSFALIDSGATNALRPASECELSGGRVIKVDLASGVTELRINECGTLLHSGPCQVIIPAGYLIDLGYSLTWKKRGCKVRHPGKGTLDVTVVKGCPLVPREVGLEILAEYEGRKKQNLGIRRLEVIDTECSLDATTARAWLRNRDFLGKGISEREQFTFLVGLFPGVPREVLAEVCVPSIGQREVDYGAIPWNRRLRRSVERAKPGTVLVNCSTECSGWKGLGRVVSLRGSKQGLASDEVFRQLLRWAELGVIGGVISGDRREASMDDAGGALENFWDEVEGKGPGAQALRKCSVVKFREMLGYAVAQAVAEVNGFSKDVVEDPEDGEPGVVDGPPLDITDPKALAEWALKRAAAKLAEKGGGGSDKKSICGTSSVFLAYERGKDPKGRRLSSGEISDWAPVEVNCFRDVYGLNEARFDQGCLGMPELGSTSLLTSSWFLYEMLHQVKAEGEMRLFLQGLRDLRILTGVPGPETWSTGLRVAVRGAWKRWKEESAQAAEIAERKVLLARMTEAESYARHVERDHVPYRKGCPVCISAQGRQRSHWRSAFPSIHSVSVDIAGPLLEGTSYDPEASGRDKGGGYKYFLACSYAVPKGYEVPSEPVAPVKAPEDGDYVPPEHLPEEGMEASGELFPELFLSELEGGIEAVKVVSHRLKGKQSEPAVCDEAPGGVGVEGGVGEMPVEPKYKNLTLFVGMPLRTKRGKEVLLAVQSIINRLEAYGYPVHRYHSDRAKELRSTSLLGWLKNKGLHATFTAGESPAGNRAEVAVQSLKGSIRKLLSIADIPRRFWPVALLHASARNWADFAESLGVPQPPILPFGTKVQARQRTHSGYAHQFQPRTVPGVYLGPALNTPGGHVVLVDKDGSSKVLLTNTVYPVRISHSGGPVKPKRRLTGKRSAFEIRVAAAAVLEPDLGWADASRCSPGGESSYMCSFRNEGDVFGQHGEEESSLDDFENGSREELGGSVVLEEFSLASCVERRVWVESDTFRESLEQKILQGEFDDFSCLGLLENGPGELLSATRPIARGKGQAVLYGLYGLGGFHGISNATEGCPCLVRYLNRYLETQVPGHLWTTIYLTKNARVPVHRDLRNASGFPIGVKALGGFLGGGLWIEGEEGRGPVCKTLPNGTKLAGDVHDIRVQPAVFSGIRWHVAEEWHGADRWVLSAFVPRDFKETSEVQWNRLRELGFPVDRVLERALEEQGVKRIAEPPLVAECDPSKGSQFEGWKCEPEWVAELPTLVWDEEVRQGWLKCHDASSRLCRLWSEELCETQECPELILGLAERLREAELVTEWLERGLAEGDSVEGVVLKALQSEIPLGEDDKAEDQFLQTRTIGLSEARRELSCWRDPAMEEVTSLEVTNEAVVRVEVQQVDQWVEQGIVVIQLPGKCVLTRKSGTGRRRCRAVCCGNYLPAEKLGLSREDVYASGAEGVTLRIALAFAARYVSWKGFTIDVKSAFLYAPIGAETKGREERIVVKPPAFLTELGILKSTDRWWVKKALYGLPTSPKDWGNYRDREFRGLLLHCGDKVYGLLQSKADESLWFIRERVAEQYQTVVGLLVVYVDDLAVFSEPTICQAFIQSIQNKWQTSTPTWFGAEPVTFCGVEIVLTERGYRLAQTAYLQELLQRFHVKGTSSVPLNKWVEPELPKEVSVDDVRAAQALTGALLWISTRSRPDISYSVSKMGQMATKAPKVTIEIGMQVLAYLSSTSGLGIEFLFDAGSYFSEHGNLNLPRTDATMEVYSDASHSPAGDRSTQCVIILWRGSPLVWESSRQPFTTLSSAESELVSMVHSIQLAESLQPLVDEMISDDSTMSLLGDNAAAVRAFESAGTGWRNRHLRMRAVAGRERILAGILRVAHLPGEFQVADLGTKPLSRTRIFQLLGLINIREPVVSSTEARAARVLSRVSLNGVASGSVSAKAIAGLVLLASLPEVKGQPTGDQADVGLSWLVWVVGILVTISAGIVGGWLLGYLGGESLGIGEGPRVEDGELQEGVTSLEGSEAHEVVDPRSEEVQEEPSDEFSQAEWEQAQRKLIDAEKTTGLTFLQRAKLRKQLAKGDLVEPPVFQQRYGPLPFWMTGKESGDQDRFRLVRTSEEELVSIFVCSGVVLLAFIGVPGVEWGRLRACGRRLRTNVVITLASRVRDTGSADGMPPGENVHGEFRFGRQEGDGSRWTLTDLRGGGPAESSTLGTGNQDGPVPEPPSGIEGAGRLSGSEAWVGSFLLSGEPGEVLLSKGALSSSMSQHGLMAEPEVMSGQIPEDLGNVPLQSPEDVGNVPLQSPEDVGNVPLQSLDGVEVSPNVVAAAPWESSDESESSDSVPSLEPLDVAGFVEGSGDQEQVEGGLRSFEAGVGFLTGGSSSSQDVFRGGDEIPEETTGGASSSHGWNTTLEACYEDVFEPVDLDSFPIVGTWLRLHFLVQLMSTAGEIILAFLGERSESWGYLRCTSMHLRAAIVAEVASVLRRGPRALEFEGPQWFDVVERWIVVGWLGGSTRGGIPGSIFQGGVGDPVGVAPPAVGAGHEHAETGQVSSEEDREDDSGLDGDPVVGPRQELAAELAAESSSDSSSTTEPSVVSVSSESEDIVACDPDLNRAANSEAVGPSAVCETIEGRLIVRDVDDLATSQLSGEPGESTHEGSDLALEEGAVGGLWPGFFFWGWLRLLVLLGVFLWVVLRGIRGVGAVEACSVSSGCVSLAVEPYPFQALTVTGDGAVEKEVVVDCDGSTFMLVVACVMSIGIWEILKRLGRWVLSQRRQCYDRKCQTLSLSFIPMPLEAGVPHRAHILYSLWRAGYVVRADGYPRGVRRVFEGLVGDWLVRNEEGIFSSPSSSGSSRNSEGPE